MTAALPNGAVRLGGPRQRAILAALLLEPGRVVPVERIVDAVWGPHAPSTARNQIAAGVCSLRRDFRAAGLGSELIGTSPPGYVLQVGADSIDLHQMERCAAEARTLAGAGRLDEAVTQLRDALAMWQGRPLVDIEGRLAHVVERIEERRVALTEECLGLELRLGRARAVIPELQILVERHPFREQLRACLMVALTYCGRTADALTVFRDGRRLLVEELGVEPGPQLREMHDRILQGDEAAIPMREGGPCPEWPPLPPSCRPATMRSSVALRN
ncbi:BTAD domain-containing putative transcriptional regulator [Micromonospora sp. NPDC047730]|uniref:AfsR/SARP family transcriptional regulator n=1 Tax=Micromonospora sp. NPDC047730 TaxID=3364253 RepID=UPI0037102F32